MKTIFVVEYFWQDVPATRVPEIYDTLEQAMAAAEVLRAEQVERADSFDEDSRGKLNINVYRFEVAETLLAVKA